MTPNQLEDQLRNIEHIRMSKQEKEDVWRVLCSTEHGRTPRSRRKVYPRLVGIVAAIGALCISAAGIYEYRTSQPNFNLATTDESGKACIAAVQQLVAAWNLHNWSDVRTLLADPLPIPFPDDMFLYHQHDTMHLFRAGTPYTVKNWKTYPVSLSTGEYIHTYPEAIVVPVHIQINNQTFDGHIHCVLEPDGQWRIAYNFIQGGFEWWP